MDKLKIYMLQEEAEAHWTKQRMGDQIKWQASFVQRFVGDVTVWKSG